MPESSERPEPVLDENWKKNATHQELDANTAGEMLRFMVTTIACALTERMVQEEDPAPDEYAVGMHNCAVELIEVISAVLAGGDPMNVKEMSMEEMLKIISML